MASVAPAEKSSSDTIVLYHNKFMLTTTGAQQIGVEPSFEEWAETVEWAQRVEKASPFWVGDLLIYGDRFGEEATQVLESTAYSEKTCANAKYTANAIPPERRRAAVPFSHHHEVASLSAEEQDHWLQKCEAEGLTREELRVQLKAAKAEATGQTVEFWVQVRCKDLADQQKLVAQLKAEGRQVRLSAKGASDANADSD